jgi:hypothetical protein
MLNLTDRQIDGIGRGSFVARMRSALAERFPAEIDAMPGDEFAQVVEGLVRRAAGYGLADERSAAVFVATAWLLGQEFDVQHPELAALLADKTLLPMQKSAALEAFATALLEALAQASEGRP